MFFHSAEENIMQLTAEEALPIGELARLVSIFTRCIAAMAARPRLPFCGRFMIGPTGTWYMLLVYILTSYSYLCYCTGSCRRTPQLTPFLLSVDN
jgi:hypothetical protein